LVEGQAEAAGLQFSEDELLLRLRATVGRCTLKVFESLVESARMQCLKRKHDEKKMLSRV
jgi:energy-converting hydrogenase A subunit M